MFLQEQAVELAEAKEKTTPHFRPQRQGCNWRQQPQLSTLCALRDNSEACGMHLLLWKLPVSEALIRAGLNVPSRSLSVLIFFELAGLKDLLCLGSCAGGRREPDVCQTLTDTFHLYSYEDGSWISTQSESLDLDNFMDELSNIFLVYYIVKL